MATNAPPARTFAAYDEQQVRMMHDGVRHFITTHPA
jgi:hypothetical protein